MPGLRALFLGTIPKVTEVVRRHFRDMEEVRLEAKGDLESFIGQGHAKGVQIVLAGPDFSSLSLNELGQTLRMAFQETQVYYVSDHVSGFDRPELMRNGFHEAFLLPGDIEQLGIVIAKAAIEAEHRIYSTVRLVDIEPGTKLEFDLAVFLPANNRYLTYSNAGDQLETTRLERLRQYKQNSVYVPVGQIKEFHKYSAKRLHELANGGGNGVLTETERQEKLRTSVRELLLGMISESYSKHLNQGKKVVDHTRKIVEQLILLAEPGEWYKRLVSETGQKGDAYTHVSSVSTYAAMFAVATQKARPDEMAIAGLYHDLGMSLLPAKLQEMRPEQMNKVELEQYRRHPQMSIEVLQQRKLVVPESVIKAIAQHHERWNGTGFPEALEQRRFSNEGQILAMADRFDYLTRAEKNLAVMSPDQAMRQLDREFVADPEMIRELRLIFDQKQKAAS